MIPSNVQSIKIWSLTFATASLAALLSGSYALSQSDNTALSALVMSGVFGGIMTGKALLTPGMRCSREDINETEQLLIQESRWTPVGGIVIVGALGLVNGSVDVHAMSFTVNLAVMMTLSKYIVHRKNRQCITHENSPS